MMCDPSPDPLLLDVNEAARRLAVGERYVRRLVTERRLRHYKVGRLLRFDPADVDAFLESGRRDPAVTR